MTDLAIWQNDGKKDFAMGLPMARTERTHVRTNERQLQPPKSPSVLNTAKAVDNSVLLHFEGVTACLS